jgi:hypothetical protein
MPLVPIQLPSRSNPSRFTQGGSTDLVNCIVEDIGQEGKSQLAIYAADGLQGFAAFAGITGGIRAALEVDGALYVVAATQLWKILENGDVTSLGSMSISASAPVYMARNRRSTPDIAIVCDGVMYYYRTSLAQVVDVDLLAPQSLDVVDGQFLIGTADNKWQIGDIDDASSWDALSFERADASPDAIVRVFSRQNEALIFGEYTCEFWRNVGGADATGFERSAVMDLGCLAEQSVARIEQTIAWVAHDRTVRLINGYAGQRISTPAVERDIEGLADTSTIRGMSWTRDGHSYYAITSDDWSWQYDTLSGGWTQRRSKDSFGADKPWTIVTTTEVFGKVIAGDRDDPIVYDMSSDFNNEAGTPIVMEITLAPVHAFPHPITVNAIYIDVEKGVGHDYDQAAQVTDAGLNPEIVLSWSRDGGATFTGRREIRIGRDGERRVRVRTHRLGQANQDGYVFKLQCSADVARAIYGMQADIERDRI